MELLERDGCLRQLEAAQADALAGHGRVALVSGEAGIGKTTLVQCFGQIQRQRVRVLWGACDVQFTPRPLGPVHDMAAQLDAGVRRLLASGAERAEVFRRLLDEFGVRPTMAIFEDVHWADEATLDLLGFLARRLTRSPTLLVLTYRDDELGPRHPLRLLLGDLAISAVTRRIGLSPLSEHAIRVMVGARDVDVAALHGLTAGNPFFVTEALANPGTRLPPTVRDAVLARAARLSTGAQEVLQAAAIVGPRVESWLLPVMGLTDARLVDECLAVGGLVAQSDMLAFRHELARQVVLETISPARRVELHSRALLALRTTPTGREDAARLAQHAAGAHDRAAIHTYATAAAQQAAAATAHREAAALYRLALSCAEDLVPPERAALLEAYSWECNVIDQRPQAIAARQTAVAVWRDAGDTLKQAENLARQVPMLIGVGNNAEAERCSDEAVRLLEPLPPGAEGRARAARSRRGDDEALSLSIPIDTSQTLGMVRAARAEAAWLAGNPGPALEEACAGFAVALRERHAWVAGELAYWRWRAGAPEPPPDWIAAPFALHVASDWRGAAEAWRQLGCPYEEARALADGDTDAQATALSIFDRIGARPAANELRRVMRRQGASRVPRGPHASTRANRFGLTSRQLEILLLLADGSTNAEIAARLAITAKTAEHHVAAVMAKLDVHSRTEAVAVARERGIYAVRQ